MLGSLPTQHAQKAKIVEIKNEGTTKIMYTPISKLDMFIKDFTLKVRLIKKFPVKTFHSKKRNKLGKL